LFEFTPKFKNAGAGGDKRSSISVDVDGDEVLRFFKFGDSNAVLVSDLSALCGLALGYVALAFRAAQVDHAQDGRGLTKGL
jgi:hypothetical protein